MKKTILIILTGLMLFSCVPPTKFKTLQSEARTCEEENELLRAENERISVDIKEARSRLALIEDRLSQIGKDTIRWKNELHTLQNDYNQIDKDYQDLYEANQALIKGSGEEIRRLMSDLQETQKDLQAGQSELDGRRRDIEKMQAELEGRNAKLAELEKILNEQEETVAALTKSVSDALLGFEDQGLSVTQKAGKVYVSLDEQLLFSSGSTVVDQKGITALKNLARVLEQNTEITIMIEGHTDDVPVKSGSVYTDNWDLSVLRATAVVRILLEDSGIDPARITTAGRGQFQPVDPQTTTEARQKNRRTEIILSPKLDELYKLIEGS